MNTEETGDEYPDAPGEHPDVKIPSMGHATVILDGKKIPLIGIPSNATEQDCTVCQQSCHLSDITLDYNGNPVCSKCGISRKELRPEEKLAVYTQMGLPVKLKSGEEMRAMILENVIPFDLKWENGKFRLFTGK